jgi:hypothetical protein
LQFLSSDFATAIPVIVWFYQSRYGVSAHAK